MRHQTVQEEHVQYIKNKIIMPEYQGLLLLNGRNVLILELHATTFHEQADLV
jgi:hypothetical protein